MMQRARLFDGVGPDGEPYFAPDRARIDDPAERARVAEFLGGGRLIRRTTGRDVDRLDPDRGRAVPMSTHTDGTWIWNAGLRYYVQTHGIAPEPAFLQHIVRSGYRAGEPDDDAMRQALTELRAAQRPPADPT
jgi:hypothetical protein